MGGLKTGRVVSDAMSKTVVVEVERLTAHPVYRRRVRTTKRYLVHDEKERCRSGDVVSIRECRPLSRHKRWRLHDIVRRGVGAMQKEPETRSGSESQESGS